jgi:hypothetical protein
MTEEDAWQEIERKQKWDKEHLIRQQAREAALDFIESNDPLELGAISIQRAFEFGYRHRAREKQDDRE